MYVRQDDATDSAENDGSLSRITSTQIEMICDKPKP